MINYDALVEDFPEYLEDQKSKSPVLFGLFHDGKHIVISGSKNTWRSKSAASGGLRSILNSYLYNKVGSYGNYLYPKQNELDTVKRMLLEKGIIEIKEIK
jgi:hypothetical protein